MSRADEDIRELFERFMTKEEAAGAAHESLGAVTSLFESYGDARREATEARRASEVLQTLLV